MPDYSRMKNADLEAILKSRGLQHHGKKAEMVKRLEENDAAGDTAAKKDEDEIDWDDEPTAGGAAAPAAAPAQQNSAQTPTLKAPESPTQTPAPVSALAKPTATTKSIATAVIPSQDTKAEPEQTKLVSATSEDKPAEHSAGLAITTVDEEIARRKARAKKFGMDEAADEVLRAMERAKKFGTTDELSDKLNQALPERRGRKRVSDQIESDESRKRDRHGRQDPGREGGVASRKADGSLAWMNEADRAKAEARKSRFAATA